MRRMSQVHFEQVTNWQGAKLAHERFVTDYNAQPHWWTSTRMRLDIYVQYLVEKPPLLGSQK